MLDCCLVANDKYLSSCLRAICLKYLNIYAGSSVDELGEAAAPPLRSTAGLKASVRSVASRRD